MVNPNGSYEVELNGEVIHVEPRLDPKDEGRPYYDVDDDPEGESVGERGPHPRDQDLMADPDASASMFPISNMPAYKGLVKPGTYRLCKNDLCDQLVEPSVNPGVQKLFCCRDCAHNYHNRLYEKRTRGWILERHKVTGEQMHFNRTKPGRLNIAERRYKSHLNKGVCPNSTKETNTRCPSHVTGDYYSKNRLCLIYAVLVDDLYEELAKSRSETYLRRWTTDDGRWVDVVKLPHMEHTQGKESGA